MALISFSDYRRKTFNEWIVERFDEAARRKKSSRLKKRPPVANVSMDAWIKAVQSLAKDLEEYKRVKKISDQKAKEQKAKAVQKAKDIVKSGTKAVKPKTPDKAKSVDVKEPKVSIQKDRKPVVDKQPKPVVDKKQKIQKKKNKPIRAKGKKIQSPRPIIKKDRRGELRNG